jgi:hypothetical protein
MNIAHSELLWIKKDGTEVCLRWRHGTPYQRSEHEWACSAELVGCGQDFKDISAACSLTPLVLAIRLIADRIGWMIEQGEWIFFQDEKTEKFTKESFY